MRCRVLCASVPSAQTAQPVSGGVKQAQAVKANPLAKSTPPPVANSMGVKQNAVGTATPQANLPNPRAGVTQPQQLKTVGTPQQVPQVGTPKATPTQQRQPLRPPQQVQKITQKRQNVGLPR